MADLEKIIKVARGKIKADIVLKDANLVNVYSGEIYRTDVAILDDRVVGLGRYNGIKEWDLGGKIVAPGFIDGHVHLESSMVTIPEFAKVVVPLGTTSVVSDPHEIANVMGLDGINYMLKSSKYNPLNVYVMISSCVPSSPLETSGSQLRATDVFFFLNQEWILGLAEVMDYPRLLEGDPGILDKIKIVGNRIIDGHAPGLTGKDLCAYTAMRVSSDHECSSREEALEKLRLGMTIMIREGGLAKNLEALIPLVTPQNLHQFVFCTDDRQPQVLIDDGHMNAVVRKALQFGLDPVSAIRMCTINTARHYNLEHIGAIAPGKTADIVVIDNFKDFTIEMVFKNGKLVAKKGKLLPYAIGALRAAEPLRGSVNIQFLRREYFEIPAQRGSCRVIRVVPNQLLTKMELLRPKVSNGKAVADIKRDILKLAVVERHFASSNIGLGLVKGFGLKKGAIASSVAHDAHNIVAVGTNDADIMKAIIKIRKLHGGLTAVVDEKLVGSFPLPIAGLMSDKSVHEVKRGLDNLIRVTRNMGCGLDDPFMMLSFLSLPVIPELKLTDKGLVDVAEQKIVPLFTSKRA
jgi:adenine deaminase